MGATIHRYSNDGKSLGVLTTENAVHEEDLDGSDSLSLVSRTRPDKRERLVWQDNAGDWHEHIVDSTTDDHSGHNRVRIECLNSIVELAGVEASGDKAKKTVNAHLADLLAGTRWTVGTCSDFAAVELETFHKNVRECITDLLSLTSGELVITITVNASGVTNRSIGIVEKRGSNTVRRAFTYRHNMASVRREVGSDEVYTAVIGYGAKQSETSIQKKIDALEGIEERTEEQNKELAALRKKLAKVRKNEYAERLRVEVTSNLPLSRWGVPKGDGTFGQNYYIYTDSNCSDPKFLKRECRAIANAVCRPAVRYRFDINEVDSDMWTDVRLGNRVLCIDEDLGDVPNDPNSGTRKRISHIRRQLAGRMSCVIEIGERTSPLLEQFVAAERISRAATGNKTKVAAKTPIPTNGNYPSGDVNWYDPDLYDPDSSYYDPESPDYIGPYPDGPAAISIIVPPDKLSYYEGEKLDYNGIQVQLLDGEGAVYTSGDYPDGMVPFGELTFPIATAECNQSSGTIYSSADQTAKAVLLDTNDVIGASRYGWVSGVNYSTYQYENDNLNRRLATKDLAVQMLVTYAAHGDDGYALYALGVSNESARVLEVIPSESDPMALTHYSYIGNVSNNGFSVLSDGGSSDGSRYEGRIPFSSNLENTSIDDMVNCVQQIPVRFGELEAMFEITILGKSEASEDGNNSGWTDMGDGFSGHSWDDEDEPFWPYGNPGDDIQELY